jgi:capsule polysaccharide export protein KpsE/RkpR
VTDRIQDGEREAAELVAALRSPGWSFEIVDPLRLADLFDRLVVERDAAERALKENEAERSLLEAQVQAQRDLRKLAEGRTAEYAEMAETAERDRETFRIALQNVQGIVINGIVPADDDTPWLRLDAIDALVYRTLPDPASATATTEGVASQEVKP